MGFSIGGGIKSLGGGLTSLGSNFGSLPGMFGAASGSSALGGLFGGPGDVGMPDPSSYMPLVNQQARLNRVNQSTPFGSLKFEKGRNGRWKANQEFGPEINSLFKKQFKPGAYDEYSTDYMDQYNELLAPGREKQMDQFQQSMFNRGMPEGGDLYGDLYRTTVGDPNARQDLMAAQSAAQFGDQAKMNDFNRLMAAMGGSAVPVPNVDANQAANLSMNANIANQNSQNQANSSIWNTAGMLGAGAFMSSRSFKHNGEPVSTLDKLISLPVERWDYKPGHADGKTHIGTYAEDFRDAFGVGDGKTIAIIDMMGVMMRAIQELAIEVRK